MAESSDDVEQRDRRSLSEGDEIRGASTSTRGSHFLAPAPAVTPVRQSVEFSVKGPISLYLEEDQPTSPGCAVLDIIFSFPATVGELTLRNYYTQSLSLFVRYSDESVAGKSSEPGFSSFHESGPRFAKKKWVVSIERKELMKHVHYEQGSQDFISIPATESSVEWKDLSAIRLILKQPSSVWHTFHVEELNVYRDLPRFVSRSHSHASSEQCQQINKLMAMLRNQTYEALTWSPKQDSGNAASKSSPRLSLRDHQKTGGYEVVLMPPYNN
nr:PREDICTED: nicolin-1-like [Bemisia tabaci]